MRRGLKRPPLKLDIETAQTNTPSAAQAAKYLNVSYNTYKKWARYYGLHEGHVNPTGKGIRKGGASRDTIYNETEKVLRGEKQPPKYNRFRFRLRLVDFGFIREKCAVCSMEERRITDGKVPLILSFKDGDKNNWKLENLEMLCLNHYFLTVGNVPRRHYKKEWSY